MIVSDLLRRGIKLYPDRVALRFEGQDFSYAKLNQRVNRLANSMLRLGLRKGDRIAILAQNCSQYVETYLGSARIGVVPIPLNARLKGDELKYIINNGEARALLVGTGFLELIASIREGLPLVEHYICLGQHAPDFENYESLLVNAPSEDPVVRLSDSDVVCQIYTSGTTGLPKGAMLTHRNVLSNAVSCCLEQDIAPRDNFLMVLPLYHIAGYTLTLSTLLVGGRLIIHPTFSPPDALRSIAEDRITHAALVPVMINFLLRVPDVGEYDFSSLKNIVYGAAPITPSLLKQAMGIFKCGFIQGYGLTEAAAFVTLLKSDDHVVEGSAEQVKRLSSIGQEIIGTEVRVVNEQGEEVQAGEVGEIIARGDNIMHGYWRMPEETAETLRDGWLHTGDLATVDEAGYIAGACAIIVEDIIQWRKIQEVREQLPGLRCIIAIEPVAGALPLADILAASATPPALSLNPDDPATFIYTSGTTGPPKGAILTHRNITFIGDSIRQLFGSQVHPDRDLNLLVLPLAHLFPRVAALFHPVFSGIPVAYGSTETLAQDLVAFSPTYFIAVPRIFEKMYQRIVAAVESGPPLRRRIFYWAADVGRRVSQHRQAKRPLPLLLRLQHRLAQRLVYARMRARMGGRLRFVLSGGAPLARHIAEFLDAMGLLVLEFYGLTESVGGTVTTFDDYRFGTVGKPMPGFEIRMAEDGEILIRGNNIAGYHNNPAATAELIDAEGWLHSGDIGIVDDAGYLRIIDRKKDLIITSGGKNIAPQNIENLLKADPLISQAMLYGDRRKYIVALITLNADEALAFANERGLSTGAINCTPELLRHPAMKARVERTVQAVNAQLAPFEQIKYFTILDHDLTLEDGSLTPTLKIKRKVVMERYRALLDALYPPEDRV